MNLLWSKIGDVVVKTLISGEHAIVSAMKRNCSYRTNCFELYGFDILLDSDLKPWLLEVNLSPSLACDAPIDLAIKTNLIADTMNLIGVKKFDRRKESMNKMRNRMKGFYRVRNFNTRTGNGRNNNDDEDLCKTGNISKEIEKIINDVDETDDHKNAMKKFYQLKHKDIIKETLGEYSRRGNFVRIYPSQESNVYDQYFHHSKGINRYVWKCLYGDNILERKMSETNYKINFDGSKLSSYK